MKTVYKLVLVCFVSCFVTTASMASSPKIDPLPSGSHRAHDPLESYNRVILDFNDFLDDILLEPLARTYRFVIPKLGRDGIRNALHNLLEPINFINSIFQGSQEKAITSFWRFTVNTTWGLGGTLDVASSAGLYPVKEDFGQTLGYYHVDAGPYVVWPLFGPSTARDSVGMVVDVFTDPFNYWLNDYGVATRFGVTAVDTTESVLDLRGEVDRVALDPYATLRSVYIQKRIDLIHDGKKPH